MFNFRLSSIASSFIWVLMMLTSLSYIVNDIASLGIEAFYSLSIYLKIGLFGACIAATILSYKGYMKAFYIIVIVIIAIKCGDLIATTMLLFDYITFIPQLEDKVAQLYFIFSGIITPICLCLYLPFFIALFVLSLKRLPSRYMLKQVCVILGALFLFSHFATTACYYFTGDGEINFINLVTDLVFAIAYGLMFVSLPNSMVNTVF
ncbi:MAG: hypothetical protein MJ217_00440 [Bacilli bacterium]|nr:hypothetical protein [Bacilli bacterium]